MSHAIAEARQLGFSGRAADRFRHAGGPSVPLSARRAPTDDDLRDPPPPGGGGGGPVPFSQTKAGLEFAHQTSLSAIRERARVDRELADKRAENDEFLQRREQKFLRDEAKEQRKRDDDIRREELQRQKDEKINTLKIERQSIFSQLLTSGDDVRAVLFALGFGPESDTFDVRAQALGVTLGELKGARGLERTTERALERVTGRTDIDIGAEGVRGLGSAVGSARAFIQGGADIQSLLTSAFGVGSLREGEQPGISAARLRELVTEVTPTGVLR